MADKKGDSKPIVRPAAESTTANPAKPRATASASKQPAASSARPAAKTSSAAKSATPAERVAARTTVSVRPVQTTRANTTKTVTKPVETVKLPPISKTDGGAARPAVKPAAAAKPTSKPTEKAGAKAEVAANRNVEKPNSKSEKPKRQSAKASGNAGKAHAAAAGGNDRLRLIIITAAAVIVALALVLGVAFGARACVKSRQPGPSDKLSDVNISVPTNGYYIAGSSVKPSSAYDNISAGVEHLYSDPDGSKTEYNTANKTNTAVGYVGKVIGTVDRNIPQRTRDEGLAVYPKYGYTLSTVIGSSSNQTAGRNALIYESSYLTATGTWNGGAGGYTWMDKDGYLYSGTTAEPVKTKDKSGHHRRLYKHSAAVGLYGGDVSDDEPAIIKTVTMRARGYNGYGVTGVYAPAGEVIKITVSESDMNATGGITIHIGQALYNGKANNIWTAKNQMQRMPVILNTMNVDKNTSVYDETTHTYTAYVGSYLGGPLYIRNEGVEFTATVSGGVAYQHFILGYTTEEEFEANAESSAPYFDLEVWNYGVLHSGPKRQASGLGYDDIYKAAVLWDKVASVTTTNSAQGIVFLYDPFVAAGAAVAFPGQRSVNCPEGWMRNSLNYNGIVSSGAWGNFHEYHHNFQGYGVGNGGEVTNNGMTLVSYALFTKISSHRGVTNFGGQGLGGWNLYTSAPWALNEVLKIAKGQSPSNGNQGLALYATLLHNFGADNYIQAKVQQQKGGYGQSYAGYMKAWEEVTHNDMSYYFKDVLQGVSNAEIADNHNPDYTSVFVPVSSVYQTGRSYMYDGQKKYFKTMRPFVIPYGDEFTVDLRPYTDNDGQYRYGSVVIPNGFTYTVKNISQPQNGTITPTAETGVYKYTPADGKPLSGEIKVTLGITKDGGSVDDVDLILEFEQSHETNRMTLQRTTYKYSAANMYDDATAAYEANFSGYDSVTEKYNHSNPTQNSNTDIWFVSPGFESSFPNATEDQMLVNNDNTIHVIEGKLYFQDAGRYRIYLRGRKNCAAYLSTDGGVTYDRVIKVANGSGSSFYLNDENTYTDVDVEENSWVYFKEVLIVKAADASYIGLGYGKWQEPLVTIDEDGMYIYNGIKYTEAEFEALDLPDFIAPTSASYINAYRSSYQLPDNGDFETEYFYTRAYTYDYQDNKLIENSGMRVIEEQCANLNLNTTNWGGGDFSVLFDGITDSGGKLQLHTQGGINANSPFTLVVDTGAVCTANRLVVYSQAGRADPCFPKALDLYGSTDGQNYTLIKSYSDLTYSGSSQTLDFDNTQLRYYKLVITEATSGHLILRELRLWNIFEIPGASRFAPDSDMFLYAGDWRGEQAYSTYGHVYVGKANATMSFEFTGTRVGFVSSAAFGNNFEVYIDGVKVNSIALKTDDGPHPLTYLCDALSGGTHTVTVKCTGETSIDSVVIYP